MYDLKVYAMNYSCNKITTIQIQLLRFQVKHMENLQEKDKKRKSLKKCGFTRAGPCKWVLAWRRTSSDHNMYGFEAARGL